MNDLNTLNTRLLTVLGLSEDSAKIVVDRIGELERENGELRAALTLVAADHYSPDPIPESIRRLCGRI